MEQPNFLNSDLPVFGKDQDKFKRYPFAERISNLIQKHCSHESLVMGVYGKWGDGKSSVLNFIKYDLNENAKIETLDFNPWVFSSESELLMAFLQKLAAGINKSLKTKREDIGELMTEYAATLGLFGSLITGVNFQDVFKEVGQKISDKPIEHYKDRINALLTESGKKIVVFIDDIDRLTKQETQLIFKLVKLVGNFNNTVYVLAFDNNHVADAIADQYASGGEDFLEKIIQLPLPLPKVQPIHIRRYSIQSLIPFLENSGLEKPEIEQFVSFFDEHFLKMINSPRTAVRFVNSLSFSMPLLKGEVNPVDLLCIEGIKVLLPDLYSFIWQNPKIFTTNYSRDHHWYKESSHELKLKHEVELMDFLKSEYPHSIDVVKNMLIDLFPQIDSIFRNIVYPDEKSFQWIQQKKLCAPRYFNKFFYYTIPEGELSDVEFDKILHELLSSEFDEREINTITDFFASNDSDEIILKLQFLQSSFDQSQSENLAKNIISFANHFQDGKTYYEFIGARFHLIGLLMDLVIKQDTESRLTLLSFIMDNSSLELSIGIFKRFYTNDDSRKKLEENELAHFKEILYQRSRSEIKLQTIFDHLENYGRTLLQLWSEKEKLKHEIKELIEIQPDIFLKLLKLYTPTIYSTGYPKPYKADFNQSGYKGLSKLIDIDFFYDKSIEFFQDQSSNIVEDKRSILSDEQLVGLFQKIHLENRKTQAAE